MKPTDFRPVFDELKSVIKPYASHGVVKVDSRGHYALFTPLAEKYGKELLFAAVRINKSYVSYHLMPVYVFPELLKGVSTGLRARMQGKSCFNFKALESWQVKELAQLTKRGFERFKKGGLLE